MNRIIDIHHHGCPQTNAVTSVDYGQELPCGDFRFSIGLHPWNTSETGIDFGLMTEQAKSPRVAAIGETGLDRLRGADIAIQREIFINHARIAENLGKPLIIHAVKSIDIILELARKLKRNTHWAIHGFRGNAITAQQLVRAGLYISFGEYFNTDAAKAVPSDRLMAETDDSGIGIEHIIKRIAQARETDAGTLTCLIAQNTETFISAYR